MLSNACIVLNGSERTMSISVKPHRMDGGMITAIQVKTEGKEEYFNIPPAPFEGFEEMRKIIERYYELDAVWQEAKRNEMAARQRLELVDYKYQVAKRDFDLLVSPQKVTAQTISEPESVKVSEPEAPVPVRQERTIIPPEPTEAEKLAEASRLTQERAEQNKKDLEVAMSTSPKPDEVKEATVVAAEPPSVKKLKESPILKVAEVRDMLPPKAQTILDDMAEKTPAEWYMAVAAQVTANLEGTEFDTDMLMEEISKQGVPVEHVEKVSKLILAMWEREGAIEKEEGILAKMSKSLPEKLGFGKKAKGK